MKASRADCEGESVNSDGSDSKYCHKNKHSSQAFDVKLHGFGRTFVNEFCYIETALREFLWQKVWSYEWIIRNCFAKKKALAKVSNNPRFVDYQHEFPSDLTFHLPTSLRSLSQLHWSNQVLKNLQRIWSLKEDFREISISFCRFLNFDLGISLLKNPPSVDVGSEKFRIKLH